MSISKLPTSRLRASFDGLSRAKAHTGLNQLSALQLLIEELRIVSSVAVLVVEDHPLIRLAALELVEHAGFVGIGAGHADEAIRILEARQDIRLVFTDVEMPGTMDGVKLAHYIRERWPPIRIMVASGRAILEERQLPVGTKFFSKPYDDNSIIEEMRKLLRSP